MLPQKVQCDTCVILQFTHEILDPSWSTVQIQLDAPIFDFGSPIDSRDSWRLKTSVPHGPFQLFYLQGWRDGMWKDACRGESPVGRNLSIYCLSYLDFRGTWWTHYITGVSRTFDISEFMSKIVFSIQTVHLLKYILVYMHSWVELECHVSQLSGCQPGWQYLLLCSCAWRGLPQRWLAAVLYAFDSLFLKTWHHTINVYDDNATLTAASGHYSSCLCEGEIYDGKTVLNIGCTHLDWSPSCFERGDLPSMTARCNVDCWSGDSFWFCVSISVPRPVQREPSLERSSALSSCAASYLHWCCFSSWRREFSREV